MAKKEVWFVMKDPGGTNNVLPVALSMRKLWGEDCKISIIADQSGKAYEIISKYSVQFLEALSSGYCSEILGLPDLIVTSMCSGDSLGRSLVAKFRGQCPTVVMPDSPWGRYQKEWSDSKYYPTWLYVNDSTTLFDVQSVWQSYDATKIEVFSWPFLDKYWKFDLSEGIEAVNKLCSYEKRPIVTFLGQLEGTNEVLREVIMALNAINIPVSFIPRFHPRCSDTEKEACQRILKNFVGVGLVTESLNIDTSTLIAGSDIVVSIYSLSLIEAAALRKQTISVMTEAGYQMFRDDIGDKIVPSFGSAGYAAEVHNLAELAITLEKAITDKLSKKLKPKQEKALIVDGRNAERVGNHIASYILHI